MQVRIWTQDGMAQLEHELASRPCLRPRIRCHSSSAVLHCPHDRALSCLKFFIFVISKMSLSLKLKEYVSTFVATKLIRILIWKKKTCMAKPIFPFLQHCRVLSTLRTKQSFCSWIASHLAFNKPPPRVFKLNQESICQRESGRTDLLSSKAALNPPIPPSPPPPPPHSSLSLIKKCW